jgi:4-aminobutyrate aminotransferase
VGFLGGFHGRTFGSVSLTASKAKYHAHFGPMLPGIYHVPFGSAGLDELEQRVFHRLVPANEVAAIVVEPIQGEGGIQVPDAEFLPRLRRICDQHGILLVADEVQSGMGRTGRMWAIQHWDVEPDVALTAKGLASGMPIGAMIAKEHLMTWAAGAHGSTFGGNPVSCAAALATIALLEEGLIDNATTRGEQMQAALGPLVAAYPDRVREVRGKGLLIGVQFDSGATAAAVEHAAFQRGLMVLTAGDDVIRMSPPLVVTGLEIATGCRVFSEAVAAVAGH